MAKRPLLVYLDDEDRAKIEARAAAIASHASAVARSILHQELAKDPKPK
jgi:plasmid stability protein